MDKRKIAQDLVRLAKAITSGVWALPTSDSDVMKVVKMVTHMRRGAEPWQNEHDPTNAFYSLLGSDTLLDDFDKAKTAYYKACAKAVEDEVKKLAKDSKEDFADPVEYDMIAKLNKAL